ncbi:MAG: methyltransferase domain-containing protein [Deltaproteobacteria bacterium]|jgi:SAM-dependent methyltransferase|nr:methyltransferase domain-containing protein [Deltaproteobacteria bacterium]
MEDRDRAYYRYLQTSEVGQDTARAHREIIAGYFWNILDNHGCRDVLDVGCGLGFFLGKASRGVNAVGVDSNLNVVEHCRRDGRKIILGSGAELPLRDGVMDGIHCAHLLEHLPDPERAFMEYHRVLRDGGVLVVRVPPFDASFYDDWSHVRPFTKKSLLRLAAVAGYRHARVFYYHYDLPFRKWDASAFRLLNRGRHLPIIRQAIDGLIKLYGLPPKELVLVARKATRR